MLFEILINITNVINPLRWFGWTVEPETIALLSELSDIAGDLFLINNWLPVQELFDILLLVIFVEFVIITANGLVWAINWVRGK
jgi:hypothetical protein